MTEKTPYNSTFAIGGVSYTTDTSVLDEILYIQIKICGGNPAHRKSAERYVPFVDNTLTTTETDESASILFSGTSNF